MADVFDTTDYHYDIMMDFDILPSPNSLPPSSDEDHVHDESTLPLVDGDDGLHESPLPSVDDDEDGHDESTLPSVDDDEDGHDESTLPSVDDDEDGHDESTLPSVDEDGLQESTLPSVGDEDVTVASTTRIETSSTNYTNHSVCALIRIDPSHCMIYYRNLKIRKELLKLQQSRRLTAKEDRWRSKFIKDIKEHFPSARLIGFGTKGNHMLEGRSHIESDAILGANASLVDVESPVTGKVKKLYEIPNPEMTDESILEGMSVMLGKCKSNCKFEDYSTKKIYSLPSRTVIGQTPSDIDDGSSTSGSGTPSLGDVTGHGHGYAEDRQDRPNNKRKIPTKAEKIIEEAGRDPKQPKMTSFLSQDATSTE